MQILDRASFPSYNIFLVMKKDIHPQYYTATAVCSCGNTFEVGATVPEFRLEICSACHPLYTGKMKMVDTAGRLDRFKARLEKSQATVKPAKKGAK